MTLSNSPRRLLACAALLAVMVASGCGDAVEPTANAYRGQWQGVFTFTPTAPGLSPRSGAVHLGVATDGKFTGGITITDGESSTDMHGTISATGALSGRLEQFTLAGSLQRDAAGQLQGRVRQLLNGTEVGVIDVTLTAP